MSRAYEVLVARPVVEDLATMPRKTQSRFFKAIDLLGRLPELGHDYRPGPGDDDLPFACREYHLPDSSKSIYYTIDHSAFTVNVFALIDQRRNPAYRFRGIGESRLEDF